MLRLLRNNKVCRVLPGIQKKRETVPAQPADGPIQSREDPDGRSLFGSHLQGRRPGILIAQLREQGFLIRGGGQRQQ